MTRKLLIGLVLAAIVGTPQVQAGKPKVSPDEQLQAMLVGFSPGEPMRCIQTSKIRKMKIVDGTALVFTAGGLIYVNRPADPSPLKHDLVPIFEPEGGRLCQSALVSLLTSGDLFYKGAIRLNEWIPYTRNGK